MSKQQKRERRVAHGYSADGDREGGPAVGLGQFWHVALGKEEALRGADGERRH